jgi:hypothetical protein
VSDATWIGFFVVVAASWLGGARVLRIGLRSEDAAAAGLGFVLLCTGGIGYPLVFLRSLLSLPPEAGAASFAAGIAALSVTSAVLYFVLWRVYRPHSAGAALLCSGGTFVIAWSFLAELVTVGFGGIRHPLWHHLGASARMLPYVWGGAEALLQAGALARAGGRGGDSRRAALCGSALLSVALAYAAGLVSAARTGGVPIPRPLPDLGTACLLFSALALWAAYRRPRRERSPDRGAGRPASSGARST